jgi:serine-type D-Ala-D-Ala carboxypeptidase/endopeptidase
MKNPIFIILLLYTSILVSQNRKIIVQLNNQKIKPTDLNKKIEQLVTDANVHGLAISIFNNNKVVYQNTFGYKNATTKEIIKPSTNFYGASLSKAVFGVLVMQLVEKGILDLDKPLQSYLPKPIYEYTPKTRWHDNYKDLKTDTLYQKITARMCMAHTTSMPNWRWDVADRKLSVLGIPGEKYSYSGEGMVYLQVVLEKLLNKSLEEMMIENIFKPLKMSNSSYTWQKKFETDYCFGHESNGKLYEKDIDNEARSASTLETTLQDYTLFMEAVLQNQLLKPETTKEMFRQQIKINSVAQMGPKRFEETNENDAINLGYGLGWLLIETPYGIGAIKEGHGDGFQHYSIIFPKTGIGILIMSNSDNTESIYKELLEISIADTFTPWKWENYIPYNQK